MIETTFEYCSTYEEIANLNLKLKSLQNIGSQLDTLQTNFIKTQQDRRNLLILIEDKRLDIKQHEAVFHWNDFSKNDEAAVTTAFSTAAATLKRIEALNKNVSWLTMPIDRLRLRASRSFRSTPSIKMQPSVGS